MGLGEAGVKKGSEIMEAHVCFMFQFRLKGFQPPEPQDICSEEIHCDWRAEGKKVE